MDTEHLIRTLAADQDWRSRPAGAWLAIGLICAGVLSSMIFTMTLRPRPDIAEAMHNPFFDLKFVVTLSLAIPAVVIGLRLARPEARLGWRGWLLMLPVALLVGGIAADLAMPQRLGWEARMMGHNSRVCMVAIPALSLPVLAATLVALRHGATTRPAVTGAVAGLLSAGVAATLYASHCPDDSPLFVATWYTIATAAVTLLGAAAGSRVLRF